MPDEMDDAGLNLRQRKNRVDGVREALQAVNEAIRMSLAPRFFR
jgi:hypothetical protein